MSQSGVRSSFKTRADTICCPHCGKSGIVNWEGSGGCDDLIGIEGGFHERLSRKAPYSIELVCDSCGEAQRESPQT